MQIRLPFFGSIMHPDQPANESLDRMCLAMGQGDILWNLDGVFEKIDLQGWQIQIGFDLFDKTISKKDLRLRNSI